MLESSEQKWYLVVAGKSLVAKVATRLEKKVASSDEAVEQEDGKDTST